MYVSRSNCDELNVEILNADAGEHWREREYDRSSTGYNGYRGGRGRSYRGRGRGGRGSSRGGFRHRQEHEYSNYATATDYVQVRFLANSFLFFFFCHEIAIFSTMMIFQVGIFLTLL